MSRGPRSTHGVRLLVALVGLVLLLSPRGAAAQVGSVDPAAQPYLGVWVMEDESVVFRFMPDKVAVLYREAAFGHDFVNVYRASYGEDGARLVRVGETLSASAGPGDAVRLEVGGIAVPLLRSPDLPESLVLQAYPIAVAPVLSAEEIEAIRAELAAREARDQSVRAEGLPGDSAAAEAMLMVDADNTAYLRGLIQRVGWISRKRFGPDAARAAFILVQHSGDLRLMLTALPQIERELPTGTGSPQDFALLYDRTMAHLAEAQRYGTQASQDADGSWAIRCLESEVMVDDFRARLGLPPLVGYLVILAEAYGVDEVSVEPACPW